MASNRPEWAGEKGPPDFVDLPDGASKNVRDGVVRALNQLDHDMINRVDVQTID